MSDLKIQGEVSFDTTKAEQGLTRVEQAAGRMAQSVKSEGDRAARAAEGVGEGFGVSERKITSAEAKITASIKRATTQLELLGKSASQKLEFKIAAQGLDSAKFEQDLAKLRELEARAAAASVAAANGLGKIQVSAAQTAAAMRQVPAQFTDIVTSLQAGQAPMTVLLQQGGQLKDAFGGVGNAARAMGGYIAGLVNPFTVAAAAAAGLFFAYERGRREFAALDQAMVASGNSIGVTAGQLAEMSKSLSSEGFTRGAAAAALSEIARTGAVAGESIQKFAKTAIDMERFVGTPVSETVKAFKELGNEPARAVLRLNESLNFLTAAQYEQIKSLEEVGRKSEAAAMAQQAYADALQPVINNASANLGFLEKSWKGVGDAAKWAWDKMLNVGRQETGEERLSAARARLAELQSPDKKWAFGISAAEREQIKTAAQNEVAYLERVLQAMKEGAKAQEAYNDQQKARIEWMKDSEKYLTKQEKLESEIAKIRAAGAAAGADQAEIEKRVSAVREAAQKTRTAGIDHEQRLMAKLGGVNADYMEQLTRLQAMRAAGNLTEERYIELVGVLIEQQPMVKEMRRNDAEAAKVQAKAAEEAAKSLEKWYQERAKEAADIDKQIEKRQEEIAALGLSKQAAAELAAAKLEVAAASQEEYASNLRNASAYAGEFSEAYKQAASDAEAYAAKLRKMAGLTREGAAKEAIIDAAKDAQEQWAKTAQTIEQSLTDALMRGFENGNGFAENFRKTLVNMFRTMVLRPVIQAIVSPIAGSLTNAMGITGAGANGGLLGSLNTASSLNNLYTLATTGYAGAVGSGVSALLGQAAGNAALGTSLGLGAGSSQAAAIAAAQAGGTATAGTATAASLGSSIAAAVPYVAAVVAIAAISKATKGETRAGGYYRADGSGTTSFVRGPSGGEIAGSQVEQAISGTVLGINRLLADMGSTSAIAGFQAGLESSGKGRGGVLAGGTLTTGAKFGEDGSGSNYDGTFFESTSTQSPDSQTAFANFTTDLKQATLQALQAATDIPKAISDKLAGVDVESLTDEATTALLVGIEAQVSAVGQLRAAVADLPFAEMAKWSFDATSNLIDLAGGLEALASSLTTYYDSFYSETEKTALVTQRLTKEFESLGLALPADRLAYRAQVEAAMADGNEELVASLLRLSSAFASVTDSVDEAARAAAVAAETAAKSSATGAMSWIAAQYGPTPEQLLEQAKTATDAAFETLKRSVDAQKKLAESAREVAAENVKTITSIFDLLKQQIAELRGVAGAGMTAAAGRAFIDQAIATARTTGYLPEQEQLSQAIAAARSGLTADAYGSSLEMRRDQLRLAGSLEELQLLTGDQLDSANSQLALAEQQLTTLDNVLATAQSQLDALRGIDNSVLSVEDAVRNLKFAVSNESSAAAAVANKQSYFERYPDVAQAYANRFTDPNLASTVNLSPDEFAALHFQLYGQAEQRTPPGYATGGFHAGGARIVGENGPELEVTGPSRIYSASQTASLLYGGQEVAGEVRGLREENRAQARAMAELQARMTRLLERWDGDGMPEVRVVTA